MKYLGRSRGTPPDGWHLHSFADAWIAAGHEGDSNGPLVFKPTTVRVEGDETETMQASYARYQEDPSPERETVGGFWVMWILKPDGTFARRARTVNRNPNGAHDD